MRRPAAVLISDVHYSLSTLEVADKAMRMAIEKANILNVPLIVAGDLHDTKANMRGECVNAMLDTFTGRARHRPYIIVGNHDRLNEKAPTHSLNFLREYCELVTEPTFFKNENDIVLLPYFASATEAALSVQKHGPNSKILIMHQGIQGSDSGEYIQDKTAIKSEDVAGLRVISGHYHRRQTKALPNGGQWDYIGNPYTLGYGEANDPPKGFQVLYSDGSLEFVLTNLRTHTVIEIAADAPVQSVNTANPTWVKVSGTKEQLVTFDKSPYSGCRIDLIPTETTTNISAPGTNQTKAQLLDQMIDSLTATSEERKIRLKQIWRDLCES